MTPPVVDTGPGSLHSISAPTTAWSRVNVSEVMPGIQTPLSWAWWERTNEEYERLGFFDVGLESSPHVADPSAVDHRAVAIFYGRAANNVDTLRRWYAAMPGDAGLAVERAFIGDLVAPTPVTPSRRRAPVVLAKLARQLVVNPRDVARTAAATTTWWQTTVSSYRADDIDSARRDLEAAARRFVDVFRVSLVTAVLAGLVMSRVAAVAARARRDDLLVLLLGGYDAQDSEVSNDLWDVSRDRLAMDAFLARWGYRAPLEGELSSTSWGEDPSSIRRLVATYRTMDDDHDPRRGQAQRAQERAAAQRELLAALHGARRLEGRIVLRVADRFLPLRNYARTATIQVLDGARRAARALGTFLAASDVLARADDVFFLTWEEAMDELATDARATVARRRAQRAEYEQLDLPTAWIGNPVPQPLSTTAGQHARDQIIGLGVSAGIAEGTARVIVDPNHDADLQPGEILVCETTDVSWISYFVVAAAVVIDIGTTMSHGAIAARELGIPCVVDTRVGTHQIGDGDRIRVDGTAGTIEFVDTRRTP